MGNNEINKNFIFFLSDYKLTCLKLLLSLQTCYHGLENVYMGEPKTLPPVPKDTVTIFFLGTLSSSFGPSS